mmetsp:Transcript_30135/g.90280  ORF Transcript_30135/g.90280 Transcript_30135/m.90280 type:complete len:439 (+) Transcript_30135:71-1387(+)
MARAAIMITCLLGAGVHGQTPAAQIPAITAGPTGAVVVRVAAGQNATVEYQDATTGATSSSPIATFDDIMVERASRVAALDGVVNQAIFNLNSETSSNFSEVAQQLAQVQSAQVSLAASIASAVTTVNASIAQLANAIDALRAEVPTNVSCPPLTAIGNGVVSGHGSAPGAVRVVRCNRGFSLSGSASGVLVCQATGQWSENPAGLSCVSSTSSPTPAPTAPPEMVTCCIRTDDRLARAYADGVRLAITPATTSYNVPGSITFPSSTQVLALHVYDNGNANGGGCMSGQFVLVCGSPSNATVWSSVETPNAAWNTQNSNISRIWSIRTARQTSTTQDPMVTSSAWTTPSYSAAAALAAGFQQLVFITWDTGFLNRALTMFQQSNQITCPTLIAGSSTHFGNTVGRLGSVCGGPGGRTPPPGTPRDSRINWFVRITPNA